MIEIIRMTSVLLLDFWRLLSVLIQNVRQVLLLLIIDECSLLGAAIDILVVLYINWSLHSLILAIYIISGILVILMMHRFGSWASVGLRANHTLATVSLYLYSTLDGKVLSLTLSSLVTRTRCRLGGIWINFIVCGSDHGVGHALIALLAVCIIITNLSFHILNLWRHHINLKGLVL